MEPDGELTVEFAEMERYSKFSATKNTVNDYWCALAEQPELLCLDIGAPSTLGNTLNTTSFNLMTDTVFSNGNFIFDIYSTVDAASPNLFGQYDRCDGKEVGDGVINVFDIATLISYIFKDYGYANLDSNPTQVRTVEGRDRLRYQCQTPTTRIDYMAYYAEDTCVYFDDGCNGKLLFSTGCLNPEGTGMNRQVHIYDNALSSQTKREICAVECELRNCTNFEIQENECLTYMEECTDASSTNGLLHEVYRATYSCHHDYLPTPPPSMPPPPPIPPTGRRLGRTTAHEEWGRWQSAPALTNMDTPMTTRSWLPTIAMRHDIVPAATNQLAIAHHTLFPDYDYANGRWYTLRTASVSLRLHAVLTGLNDHQEETKLSYRAYDGSPPDDPSKGEVRYTRFCEFDKCLNVCASIEASHPSRTAMQYSTLELVQRPIKDACPFETHIWVPFAERDTRCVGVEYIVIGDGLRGQFARNTACTREIFSPPPPPPLYIGLPRTPPPSSFTPYAHSPPPPNASSIDPPSQMPPTERRWLWIVSVTVLVLGGACCCLTVVLTRRRKQERDEPQTIIASTSSRTRVAPSISPRVGGVNANLSGRQMKELQIVISPPIQVNRRGQRSL
jgi:hypothetical protein